MTIDLSTIVQTTRPQVPKGHSIEIWQLRHVDQTNSLTTRLLWCRIGYWQWGRRPDPDVRGVGTFQQYNANIKTKLVKNMDRWRWVNLQLTIDGGHELTLCIWFSIYVMIVDTFTKYISFKFIVTYFNGSMMMVNFAKQHSTA